MAEAAPRRGPGFLAGRTAGAVVVAVAAVAAFATSFRGGFQFDDWNVIVEDGRVQSLAAWWRSMPGIRPLLKLSYAAGNASGLGLAGFHAVNLAIHLGAAVLALALLARLEASFGPVVPAQPPARSAVPPASARAASSPASLAALLGALLFALHPVQTEAVTYLSGRSTALAAALALASAVAWLDGRERASRWLVHGLSPLLLVAALGVKETALALPPALLLLAHAGPGPAGRWRAALRDSAVHWAVLAAAAVAAATSPAYRAMAAHSASLRPLPENVLVHLQGLGWLAGQLARPWALAADPWLPAPAGFPWAAALAGLSLLSLLGLGLAALGRRPIGVATLWFLLWLPLSGWLLPRPEPANDRQLYLALLGPAWLLGRVLSAGLAAPGWRRPMAGLAAAGLLGGLGLATAARNLVYRDEVAFWADATRRAPGNARALNNLGLALSATCRLGEAAAAFEDALAIDPRQPQARVNLWLLRQGDPPGARRGQTASCPP